MPTQKLQQGFKTFAAADSARSSFAAANNLNPKAQLRIRLRADNTFDLMRRFSVDEAKNLPVLKEDKKEVSPVKAEKKVKLGKAARAKMKGYAAPGQAPSILAADKENNQP